MSLLRIDRLTLNSGLLQLMWPMCLRTRVDAVRIQSPVYDGHQIYIRSAVSGAKGAPPARQSRRVDGQATGSPRSVRTARAVRLAWVSDPSIISFEAAGQLLQTETRAGLVVLRPQAWRQVPEHQRDFRSAGLLF